MIKKIRFKTISIILTTVIICSAIGTSTFSASAFDDGYLNKEGMELGYSIVNGYTKMYFRHNPERTNGKIAVYSGVDITNPYTLAMGEMYVLTNHIDIDKFLSNNDYAMGYISDFDSFLKSVNIKNPQSEKFLESVKNKNLKFDKSLKTAGIYTFNATTDYAYELMDENPYADFVLVDGKVPANMKDLNFDGKTDEKDAQLIQKYLAKDLYCADDDESAYALYASDYNKDKSIDISDVTDLIRDLSES